MSMILGGQERCGYGWNMFVECLAEGRGVSLPAGSVATGRQAVASVGAYTRVRKQFKVPIAEFGGIQEGKSLIVIEPCFVESRISHNASCLVASSHVSVGK